MCLTFLKYSFNDKNRYKIKDDPVYKTKTITKHYKPDKRSNKHRKVKDDK